MYCTLFELCLYWTKEKLGDMRGTACKLMFKILLKTVRLGREGVGMMALPLPSPTA